MLICQALEPYPELKVAGCHDILNLKIAQFHCETELTDLSVIQFSTSAANFFAFGPRADYFAGFKDESSRFGLSDAHDASSEAFRIIFGILSFHCNLSQVQLAIEAKSADEILELRRTG